VVVLHFPGEAVHQIRKRMKKLRGLVRLVRPAMGDQYKPLNKQFRDIARRLSDLRDADVMLEAFDETIERCDMKRADDQLAPLRAALTAQRRHVVEQVGDIDELIEPVRSELVDARDQIERWALDETGFDAVADGLAKTYGRARDAMNEAYANPRPEAFHAWRKRTKYHWHHIRLLQPAWNEPLKARRQEIKTLSDLLGDDHDLAVLVQTLRAMGDRLDKNLIEQFAVEAAARRAGLQTEATPVGAKLFAEKPKRLVKRMQRYWTAW